MRARRRSPPPRAKAQFNPTSVPEIAAGYFWDPQYGTGFSNSAFNISEGNGNSNFALKTFVANGGPTLLTDNGQQQARARNSASGSPSTVGTSGSVKAGWTGATYVAGWFRLPDASGDVTGAGNLFVHTPSSAGQRRFTWQLVASTPDIIRISTSTDGTATASSDYPNVLAGSAWVWCEAMFDPSLTLGGSTVADYIKFFADFSAQTRTANAGTNTSTLFDGTAQISVASRRATGQANVDTTDFGAIYYGNGIPSLANRKALRNRNRPVAASV